MPAKRRNPDLLRSVVLVDRWLELLGTVVAEIPLDRGHSERLEALEDAGHRIVAASHSCLIAIRRAPIAGLRALAIRLAEDVADPTALRRAIATHGAKRVIHLAGLQVPACAADPIRGARVNVIGTLAVFEAAKAEKIPRVVYASSAAVFGPPEDYPQGPAPDSAATGPRTRRSRDFPMAVSAGSYEAEIVTTDAQGRKLTVKRAFQVNAKP